MFVDVFLGTSNFTYQGQDGLVFAGRVDTGSSNKILENLHAKFQKLEAPSCPLVNFPGKSKCRWGLGDHIEDVFRERRLFLSAE
jgi:hypothetical protein